MRMILKRKNKKHNILLLILLILTSVIILSLIFINYYSNKAYPILKSYAESETKKLTVLIINKAVTKQLYNMDVEELFKITQIRLTIRPDLRFFMLIQLSRTASSAQCADFRS